MLIIRALNGAKRLNKAKTKQKNKKHCPPQKSNPQSLNSNYPTNAAQDHIYRYTTAAMYILFIYTIDTVGGTCAAQVRVVLLEIAIGGTKESSYSGLLASPSSEPSTPVLSSQPLLRLLLTPFSFSFSYATSLFLSRLLYSLDWLPPHNLRLNR
jgi:hypothetical protein